MKKGSVTLDKAMSEPTQPSSSPPPDSAPQNQDPSAPEKLFIQRLEQSGKLVDVGNGVDLSSLPPHVTHIRHADGSIERIAFD